MKGSIEKLKKKKMLRKSQLLIQNQQRQLHVFLNNSNVKFIKIL